MPIRELRDENTTSSNYEIKWLYEGKKQLQTHLQGQMELGGGDLTFADDEPLDDIFYFTNGEVTLSTTEYKNGPIEIPVFEDVWIHVYVWSTWEINKRWCEITLMFDLMSDECGKKNEAAESEIECIRKTFVGWLSLNDIKACVRIGINEFLNHLGTSLLNKQKFFDLTSIHNECVKHERRGWEDIKTIEI